MSDKPQMPAPEYSTRTSGDFHVDRLHTYAQMALEAGDSVAARDLFMEIIRRVPAWPPGHFALAKVLLALGDEPGAAAAVGETLALDPSDRLGAGLLLARLEGGSAHAAGMPDAFVAQLFDDYAPRFESHLVEALAYRAPDMLAGLIADVAPGRHFRHALDLGCGTGLMAQALDSRCARFAGVDLSRGMLAEAAKTGRYDRLVQAELRVFLEHEPDACADLALAADVFCYVPNLEPILAATRRVLEPGGILAFSIQTHEGTGAVIGADSRVHHAPGLIHEFADRHGFAIRREIAAATRADRGVPVQGALFVLAKR